MDAGLGTLADLAEILGALVVIGGVAFAVIQIRQFRRQRLEVASIELVRTFQSGEFTRAYNALLPLEDASAAAAVRGAGLEEQAMIVSTAFESIGVMVHRRILPIGIVEDLMGGTIVSFWSKLEPWVATVRSEQGRDDTHEWFQWLAERLAQRPGATSAEPAYLAHRDWKP